MIMNNLGFLCDESKLNPLLFTLGEICFSSIKKPTKPQLLGLPSTSKIMKYVRTNKEVRGQNSIWKRKHDQ